MNLREIRAAYQEMSRPKRKRFLLSLLTGFVSTMLFLLGLLPPKAEVKQAIYQSTLAVQPPGQPPSGGTVPGIPGFLSGTFSVEVSKRVRGQRIRLKEVTFFDADGTDIGKATVEGINKVVRLKETEAPQREPLTGIPEPVEKVLFLWPFESAQLSFVGVVRDGPAVKQGQRIYAEVKGRIGIRPFKLRTPTREIGSLGSLG